MRKENKNPQKKRSFVSGFFKLAVLCVAVWVAFSLVSLQIELSEKREMLSKLEEQRQELMISNAEKKELIEKSDQNEFVERIAREYFDFAYPDEQIYIDISGS
ncbi:MAG: septum formation initiator family protein [Oscillospiraceae bacterium]|nr:septum formation initiator family protein [Oscillospiraceae bacterium]